MAKCTLLWSVVAHVLARTMLLHLMQILHLAHGDVMKAN